MLKKMVFNMSDHIKIASISQQMNKAMETINTQSSLLDKVVKVLDNLQLGVQVETENNERGGSKLGGENKLNREQVPNYANLENPNVEKL